MARRPRWRLTDGQRPNGKPPTPFSCPNMGSRPSLALLLALLLAPAGRADAQARRPAQNPATLLQRCADTPDADACRDVLLMPISARQRSIALTYLAESDVAVGDSLLKEAIRLDSTNALAYVQLGIRYGSWGGGDGIALLRRAVALRPDWRHLHRRIAAGYHAADSAQVDTLVRLWRSAVAAEPAAPANHVGLGSALIRLKHLAEAEAGYRRAFELGPDDPGAIFGVCETLLRQQKLTEAKAPCERTIRDWTTRYWTDLRQILWHAEEAKDYAIALAAAEKGLEVEPHSSYFRSDRTRILHHMGREAEAEALLRKYVADNPADWSAVEELADYLYWDGQLEDARALYVRLIDPKCPYTGITCMVKGNLAVASLQLGRIDDAFRYLEGALDHQIDCPSLLENFRRHAGSRPDSAAIMARYRRTMQGIGDTVATHHGVEGAGDFFKTTEQWDRAAHFYKIALDSAVARERAGQPMGRFSSGLRWEYGHALVEQGRYCEGLRELTAAQQESPIFENGRPHLSAAMARAKERCREELS
jgi:tetratricopeptide (TPR) repeat protein